MTKKDEKTKEIRKRNEGLYAERCVLFAIYENTCLRSKYCKFDNIYRYFFTRYLMKDYHVEKCKYHATQGVEKFIRNGDIKYGLVKIGGEYALSYYLAPETKQIVKAVYDKIIKNKAEKLTSEQIDFLFRVKKGDAPYSNIIFIDKLSDDEKERLGYVIESLHKKCLIGIKEYYKNNNDRIKRQNIILTIEGREVIKYIEGAHLRGKSPLQQSKIEALPQFN